MIMKETYIGIYWGERNEGLESCANKVNATLKLLSSIDNSFKEWYKTTRPRKNEIVEPLDLSFEGTKKHLISGQNYTDIPRRVIEDLGYLIHIKSEKNYSKAHVLSISCGAYFEQIESAPNCVVLTFSKETNKEYLTAPVLLNMMYSELSNIWKPNKGIIKSGDDTFLLEDNLLKSKIS